MRGNWCIGFVALYRGRWSAIFRRSMHDVSGVTGAAPICATRPSLARSRAVDQTGRAAGARSNRSGVRAGGRSERDEWFLAGTQSGVVVASAGANPSSAVTPHIRYPAPETVIALDPDIAEEHQRVMFQASPVLPGMQWRIGDAVLADVHGRAAWSPLPGKYVLFLENEAGQALSSVPFEVRGNMAH